jgi:adenylate cyclase class IV
MQNKQNLELKHHCEDFKEVRKILQGLGAEKEIVKNQRDYFFELPKAKKDKQGRMKLRIENEKMEVIYYERPDFVVGKETTSSVALLEANPATLTFLEASLGVSAVVDKKREVWRKGNTVFHLDIVKGVGNLFEIELQKTAGITAKDRELFAQYQKALLPHLGKVIKGSNIDLVLKNRK